MSMNNLCITSEAEAKAWQERVRNLNEETSKLLTDVGKALQDVQNGADSTIVDEIAKYGGQIMSGSNKILEGMNELFNVVGSLLSKINEVLDAGKGIVKGIIGAVTGI